MEEQPVRPDLKQIVYECRDLFTRLSERNRALSEEWNDFAGRLEVRPDTLSPREEHGVFPRGAETLPQAKEFGDSLLTLHERFFETCRELLQARLETDNLKKERASLQAELARFSEKVILLGRTQAELTEQKTTYETQLKTSKQILEETERNLHRLESQLHAKREEVDSLTTNLDRITHERDAAQAARHMLESRLSEIELSRTSLNDRVLSLEKRQEELHQQVRLLEDQLAHAKARAEEFERDASRNLARAGELEKELTASRERTGELERTLEQTRETSAPVEEFLSLKRGLLQVQEERVVQAQQEAYQIETIARLEKETQDLRTRLQEADNARAQAESLRRELEDELQKAQVGSGQFEQELTRLREEMARTQVMPEVQSGQESPAVVPPVLPVAPVVEATVQPLSVTQVFEPEPFDPSMVGAIDDSLPFADFAIPVSLPPAATPPPAELVLDNGSGVVEPSGGKGELPPAPIEASLFGFEGEPPVLDSLALQEDERAYMEMGGSASETGNLGYQELPTGSALDAALGETSQVEMEGNQGYPVLKDEEPSGLLSDREVFSGEPAPDRREAESSGQSVLEEAGQAGYPEVEGLQEDGSDLAPQAESPTEAILRILDADESQTEAAATGVTQEDEGASVEDATSTSPYPLNDKTPVQPVPLPGQDPTIPSAPSQPVMDFPYPEITGLRMDRFRGKRILLVGGDERFQSDYAHLFTMVYADLLYFPSVLQLEKQGMKRHVRECDLVVVFGRAVNESGLARVKLAAEEYSRKIFEHPSSGLVSLYHRLQRVNDEI